MMRRARSFHLLLILSVNLERLWLLLTATVFLDGVSAIQVKSVEEINFSKIRQRRRRTGSRRHLIEVNDATVGEVASYLQGYGLTILNASLLYGNPEQMGVFTEGSDNIGIRSGVILSTGTAQDAGGPNGGDARTTDFNGEGYAPLDALVPGGPTSKDAVVLQIEFVCDSGVTEEVHLKYAFASEEYNEYVNEEFNDVFAIFLNGLEPADNVASLDDGTAVAINSVNCGNPYDPASTSPNCIYFVNNEKSTRTTEYDIEFDGFTVPLDLNSKTVNGKNTITIAVGDVGDGQFDSAVFLGEATLGCGPQPLSTAPNTPATTTVTPTRTPPATFLPAPKPAATTVVPATMPPTSKLSAPPSTTPPAPLTTAPLTTVAPDTAAPTVPPTNLPTIPLPTSTPVCPTPTVSTSLPTFPRHNTHPKSYWHSPSKSKTSEDYDNSYFYCEGYE